MKIIALLLGAAFAAPTNNELKIGIAQEFENFNPIIMSMSATTYMFRMVGRSLVVLDENSRWVPQLAKSIPTLENKQAQLIDGGKKIVAQWEILENAKWGDGKPIICDDFKTSLTIASNDNVSVAEKETWTMVEKIEADAKNPKKCKFTYSKARWDFYQLGNFIPVPTHIEMPIFEKYKNQKEGYEKNSNYVKNPTNPGLYSGPYVISEVKLGSHVSFKVNPQFYGKKPNIQSIIVKLIPNTGTLEANLRSGTIDMVATVGMEVDQAIAFDKKTKSENLPFKVIFTPSTTYEHIDLNLDNPILSDVRVRKALLYGINREDLVKALFEGKQPVALHNVTPKDAWFTSDSKYITQYRYSKREASKLLDEAGWKMEKDGFRYKAGKKLTFQYMTTANNKTREMVQVYLQNQWKQIGIDVTIKNEPARVFFAETTHKRNFPAFAHFAWVSSPEASPRSNLHSSQIPSAKNSWSGQNYPGWKNAEVDKALDQLDIEFNPQKRKDLIYQVLKAYTAELPVLPLYYRSDISVIPANLKGFEPTGHQFSETNKIENWSL